MEYGKSMSAGAFDWDDTALIKEYDRIMKKTKNAMSKENKSSSKKKNKSGAKKENKSDYVKEKKSSSKKDNRNEYIKETLNERELEWAVGDYCRAMYREDGLWYEATIVDIQADTCTVEFLGYEDLAEVSLEELEESSGKKSRFKQRKVAEEVVPVCASESDLSNVGKVETRHARFHGDETFATSGTHDLNCTDAFPPTDAEMRQHAEHQHFSQQHTEYQRPQIPGLAPGVMGMPNVPYAPPTPQCGIKDPSLNSMLIAWYMAGYYTGLHQNQKFVHRPAPPRTQCCNGHAPCHGQGQNCCHSNFY